MGKNIERVDKTGLKVHGVHPAHIWEHDTQDLTEVTPSHSNSSMYTIPPAPPQSGWLQPQTHGIPGESQPSDWHTSQSAGPDFHPDNLRERKRHDHLAAS